MCHDRLLGADEARRHLVRRQMFSSYLALPLTFSPSGATRASVQVHQHAVGRNESGNTGARIKGPASALWFRTTSASLNMSADNLQYTPLDEIKEVHLIPRVHRYRCAHFASADLCPRKRDIPVRQDQAAELSSPATAAACTVDTRQPRCIRGRRLRRPRKATFRGCDGRMRPDHRLCPPRRRKPRGVG